MVYRGTDGEALSEQDLTDGEGPPAHPSLVASKLNAEEGKKESTAGGAGESDDATPKAGFTPAAAVVESTSLPTVVEENEMSRASSIDHLADHVKSVAATPAKATQKQDVVSDLPSPEAPPILGVRPPTTGQSCSSSEGSEVEKSPGRITGENTTPAKQAPPVPKRAVRTPPLGEGSPSIKSSCDANLVKPQVPTNVISQAPSDVAALNNYYSPAPSISSPGKHFTPSTEAPLGSSQNLTLGICNALRQSNMSRLGSQHHAALAESMPALTSRIAASMSARNVSLSSQSLNRTSTAQQVPQPNYIAPMPNLPNALESLRVSEPMLPEAMHAQYAQSGAHPHYQQPHGLPASRMGTHVPQHYPGAIPTYVNADVHSTMPHSSQYQQPMPGHPQQHVAYQTASSKQGHTQPPEQQYMGTTVHPMQPAAHMSHGGSVYSGNAMTHSGGVHVHRPRMSPHTVLPMHSVNHYQSAAFGTPLGAAPQEVVAQWQRESNSTVMPHRDTDAMSHHSFASSTNVHGAMSSKSSVCSGTASPNYLSQLLGQTLDSKGIFAMNDGFMHSPLTPGPGSFTGSIESVQSTMATRGPPRDQTSMMLSMSDITGSNTQSGLNLNVDVSESTPSITTPTIPDLPPGYTFEETAAEVARSLVEKLRHTSDMRGNLSHSINALEEATKGVAGIAKQDLTSPVLPMTISYQSGSTELSERSRSSQTLPNKSSNKPPPPVRRESIGADTLAMPAGNSQFEHGRSASSPASAKNTIQSDSNQAGLGKASAKSTIPLPTRSVGHRRNPSSSGAPPSFVAKRDALFEITAKAQALRNSDQEDDDVPLSQMSPVSDASSSSPGRTSKFSTKNLSPEKTPPKTESPLVTSVEISTPSGLRTFTPKKAKEQHTPDHTPQRTPKNRSNVKADSKDYYQQERTPSSTSSMSSSVAKRAAQANLMSPSMTPLNSPPLSDDNIDNVQDALVRLAQRTAADISKLNDMHTSAYEGAMGTKTARTGSGRSKTLDSHHPEQAIEIADHMKCMYIAVI